MVTSNMDGARQARGGERGVNVPESPDRNAIEVRRVSKFFGSGDAPVKALDTVSVAIRENEFFTLLGPSGCGKTTLLRLIAGFDFPTDGEILLHGQDIAPLPPYKRPVNTVFQSYALFPHLTVAQNIAFGLEMLGRPKAEIDARVTQMLKLVRMEELRNRSISQISGGQQQRVALARALAPSPRMLLLDEPLSALDAKIRISLREEIRAVQRALGITTIFVTHDQEEALSMSDRIVVMHGGMAEQVGTPYEIYNKPTSKFVAGFVGTLNVLDGTVTDPATGAVRIGDDNVVMKQSLNGAKAGDTLSLALRPEAISLGKQPGRDASIGGTISEVSFLGSVIRVRVGLGKDAVSLDTFNNPAKPPPKVGEKTEISFSSADLLVLH
jgi:putative spermidine/putrescine transport system ATP-binding protein